MSSPPSPAVAFRSRSGAVTAAAIGSALTIGMILTGVAAIAGGSPKPAGPGGCWSMGKWYPEGAVIQPDLRSRMWAKGVFVCNAGNWVFKAGKATLN